MIRRLPRALPFVVYLCVAGCAGHPFGETASTAAAVTAPAAPPIAMTGRWRMVSTRGGSCAMTFTASAATEGTIAPEGGCPANFFTSRRWVFEEGSLTIQDHNRKTLIVMKPNAAGRLEGTLGADDVIRLER